MDSSLAIHLFGAFEMSRDDAPLSPPRIRKDAWALALLLLRSPHAVDRRWLAGVLWPDSDQALLNLRLCLTRLRSVLGEDADRLVSPNSRTLRFVTEGVRIDLLEFDALARKSDSDSVRQALALYRGPLLEDCEDLELWAAGEREKRNQIYLALREKQAEHLQQPKTLPSPLPPRPPLPQSLTALIGRENELNEVVACLRSARLVTLTGAGGVGKTRLALAAAEAIQDEFADGVAFVEFAALAEGGFAPQAVADCLRVREAPGQALTETLRHACKNRELLLLLDNCEHILEAVIALAQTLLAGCPGLRILTTSRQSLQVIGEHLMRVSSLTLPPESMPPAPNQEAADSLLDYDSCRLFLERVAWRSADFRLTPQNAASVAAVCRCLDGIPLALELAAARAGTLPMDEIAARLQADFRLLGGGNRGAVPRQQTIRATIEWSDALLSDRERLLLRRLSVFAGGWSLEAAAQIGGGDGLEQDEIAELLAQLTEKSLVRYEARSPFPRYRLFETIRQYAGEKLEESGDADAARNRHLAFYQALAETADPQLQGAGAAEWFDRLETEHNNLRAALAWAALRPDGAEAGLRTAAALWRFWFVRGHTSEGRELMARARAQAGSSVPAELRATALNRAANLAHCQGDYAEAKALYEQALALFREQGDIWGETRAINNLGNLAWEQGDFELARTLLAEALQTNRSAGSRHSVASNLCNLGVVATIQGDYAAAQALLSESLQISRETGSREVEANALINLGEWASKQGDNAEAQAWYGEALTLCQTLGHKVYIAVSLSEIARLAARQAQWERAAPLWGAAEGLREGTGAPLRPIEREEYERAVAEARQAAGAAAFDAAWAEGRALSLEQAITLALRF